MAQALSTVKEVVEEKTFLNVVEVVKGGSVGKGTAITDCEDAELVFFVKGLPTEGHAKWLPPLLRSVQSTLQENIAADVATKIECTDDSVQMKVKDTITVALRFSPAFDSYVKTVQALGALGLRLMTRVMTRGLPPTRRLRSTWWPLRSFSTI